MSIIYFLIFCSLSLAIIFLLAFFWAHKNGQNDDLYTPSVRILFDDEISSDEKEKSSKV
jgi:cbb3-type cytochrome oxidase maturation protein